MDCVVVVVVCVGLLSEVEVEAMEDDVEVVDVLFEDVKIFARDCCCCCCCCSKEDCDC